MSTAVSQEHADLTILDTAGGPRILAFHTDRFRTLLQEASFINDEHGF